jgi:UDP-N-acetylmuramoyl-tripeptide--D-alanyl-D-alanine ligase
MSGPGLHPLWTSDEIAAATGGAAHGSFEVRGVTFDSREVAGGELFVALAGEATDGHRFVDDAIAAGAAGLLVSRPVEVAHVRVADTRAALQALGAAARARTDAVIVGVTGSVGKTGVKEALRLAFEGAAPGRVHASVKSYNNHTGVPLSLARMPEAVRFGVFEMGMNHAGELAQLTRLVRPHVAVVTAIASAHRAFFESEEAIADAKSEIFEGLEPGGTAVIPFDSPHRMRLSDAARRAGAAVLTFGEGQGADVRAVEAEVGGERTEAMVDVAGTTIGLTIAQPGRHWLSNALCVLAAVHAAGGALEPAALALACMKPLAGRGRRIEVELGRGEVATIIDEAYNANPASMAAALTVLGSSAVSAGGRRLAILGEMRELGEQSAALHGSLATHMSAAGVDEAILVGREMAPLAAALEGHVRATHVGTRDEAIELAGAMLRGGDLLLVKGSNGVGLGRLVEHFAEGGHPARAKLSAGAAS